MALATTCPQCKTSFKVVPDQLKLRRGLVRCGVCQQVFSGIDYLRYVDDAARAPVAGAAAEPRPAAGGAVAETRLESVDTAFLDSATRSERPLDDLEPSLDEFAIEGPGRDEPEIVDAAHGAGSTSDSVREGSDSADSVRGDSDSADSVRGDSDSVDSGAGEFAPREAEPTIPETMDGTETRAAAFDLGPVERSTAERVTAGRSTAERATAERATLEPPDLAGDDAIDFFASEGRARGFTSRGAALSWLAAAALTSALLVQLAIGARHWLAAWAPPLRPAIAAAFAPLGLAVEPPRDLGALTIESFELQAAGSDGLFAASALLRNAASHPVRWPSMELTLTDGAGAVVVRKVLSPRDYLAGAGAEVLDRGIATGGEFSVRVALQGRDIAPTGYTVNLFYP